MATEGINRTELKELILETIKENPSVIKGFLKEVLSDQIMVPTNDKEFKELDKIIDRHFMEYDEVFEALA